ncbi:MAG: RdgB/HAM1 family non-canonical purine NTP pyrophosphatase [Cryomorphaceae bacterium]|nr:RdgB/HAM1 family non-canonical purine NTP pyrophosphatase [Cryomorphaceae bacterium]
MTIVLATQNPGKIAEIRALLPEGWQVVTATELGVTEDIPETGETLEENALQKAQYLFDRCGMPALADDTGLEIEALNGAPGVYSARYAGEEKDNEKNMAKVLKELSDTSNRKARFRTVLAWVTPEGRQYFEGIVNGEIADTHLRGEHGFGYDPIFVPEGEHRSFAQMSAEEKSAMSHRGRALRAFVAHIKSKST